MGQRANMKKIPVTESLFNLEEDNKKNVTKRISIICGAFCLAVTSLILEGR